MSTPGFVVLWASMLPGEEEIIAVCPGKESRLGEEKVSSRGRRTGFRWVMEAIGGISRCGVVCD